MKIKIVLLLIAAISTSAIAQKKELKEAEKLINLSKFSEAKTKLATAEAGIGSLKGEDQTKLYKIKGVAFSVGNAVSLDDYKVAIESFNKVITKEKALNANKYTVDAQLGLIRITQKMEQMARDSMSKGEFEKSANLFEYMYSQSPSDTVYLFNAAASHVNAKKYDAALVNYKKMLAIGYTGKGVVYSAKHKASGEVHSMKTKADMDAWVAKGEYSDPKVEQSPSKRGEISKNIALIYLTQNKEDKAIEAFEVAKKENPNDASIQNMEADVYYSRGVELSKNKNSEQAMASYKKAVKANPEHPQANFNIASIILAKDAPLVDQINALGKSTADYKKYEELQKLRVENYKVALPYMEKYIALKPDDKAFANNLLVVYQTLKDPKADALKAKYGL